jgi:hypothetical protein
MIHTAALPYRERRFFYGSKKAASRKRIEYKAASGVANKKANPMGWLLL